MVGGGKGEQTQAAFSQVAEAYQGLMDRRRLEQHPVKMFSVATDGQAPAMPGGSVLFVTADPGATDYRRVVEAAKTGDAARVSDAVAAVERSLGALDRGQLVIPVSPLLQPAKIPLLARVKFRGRVVADGMVVGDGHKMSLTRIPWTGARLDPDGFRADYFHWDGAQQLAETVVITREPQLSAVERRVLEILPPGLLQEGLGEPGLVENWSLAAAGAVYVSSVVAGDYLARWALQQQQQQDQPRQDRQQQGESGGLTRFIDEAALAEELAGLDARAAVATLLRLREQFVAAGRIG
jgi:hypothetical protein